MKMNKKDLDLTRLLRKQEQAMYQAPAMDWADILAEMKRWDSEKAYTRDKKVVNGYL
jgi:hypothetical protein